MRTKKHRVPTTIWIKVATVTAIVLSVCTIALGIYENTR